MASTTSNRGEAKLAERYLDLVRSLITVLELRNPFNIDHCRLVARLCELRIVASAATQNWRRRRGARVPPSRRPSVRRRPRPMDKGLIRYLDMAGFSGPEAVVLAVLRDAREPINSASISVRAAACWSPPCSAAWR